jgi:hypothetical protein
MEVGRESAAGVRSISLKAVCRVDAAFTMYVAERGLRRIGLSSVERMVSCGGRCLVFGVAYSRESANGATTQRSCMHGHAQHHRHAFDNALVINSFCANTSMRLASAPWISRIVSSYLYLDAIAGQLRACVDGNYTPGAVVVLRARLPLRPRESPLGVHCDMRAPTALTKGEETSVCVEQDN